MQSLLIVVVVGVGVAVIVFMSALLSGLQANLVRRTLSSQAHVVLLPAEEVARPQGTTGEEAIRLQKQAQRLRSIDQWQQIRDRLHDWQEIAAVSPVASGPAFVVRGDANKAITLIGIDPAHYNRVISLSDRLTAGQLRVGAGEAVIGIELAKDLGADVGDKLRISSAGSAAETLTITGLFDLGNKGVNARNVYVGLRTGQTLLDLVGGVSSIELALYDLDEAERVAQRIAAQTGLIADSWIRTNAQFVTALTSQRVSSNVIRFFVGRRLPSASPAYGRVGHPAQQGDQDRRAIEPRHRCGASFCCKAELRFVGPCWARAAWTLLMWQLMARNPDGTPLFVIAFEPPLSLPPVAPAWSASSQHCFQLVARPA